MASTEWVLAELLLSFASGRLRIITLSIALAVAMWARLDGILLLVPASLAAFSILGLKRGARAALLVGALTGAPSAAWAVRNAAVGIDPWPTPLIETDGTSGPMGYLAWTNTWITTEQQREQALWPVESRQYSQIRIPPSACHGAIERAQVQALLVQLAAKSGQMFPSNIDAAFRRLAGIRNSRAGFKKYAMIALRRTGSLLQLISQQSPRYYTIYILSMFCVAGLIATFFDASYLRFLWAMTACYVIVRIAFFVATMNLEARYMVELAPFFECAAAMGTGWLASSKWLGSANRADA